MPPNAEDIDVTMAVSLKFIVCKAPMRLLKRHIMDKANKVMNDEMNDEVSA